MLSIKAGVCIVGFSPQIVLALIAAERAYERRGTPLVITSGRDGTHSRTSLHYCGHAVDLRIHTLPSREVAQQIVAELDAALGDQFDVLLEKDHIHIEWQPKREVAAT